jgi:hypothetical protein
MTIPPDLVERADHILRKGSCILWPGCGNGRYGLINFSRSRRFVAHRIIYKGVFGEIPKGLVVDHICRTTMCVNIRHLRLLTNKENILVGEGIAAKNKRKVVCKRGHKFQFRKNGQRECGICKNMSLRKCRAIRQGDK